MIRINFLFQKILDSILNFLKINKVSFMPISAITIPPIISEKNEHLLLLCLNLLIMQKKYNKF